MSKEALKLKMDTLRDIALKIEEKENASKRLFSEAHGFFKAYSMVQTFCENYKKNELSNDKLDEKGIDIEQHTKIVNAIDEISKYCVKRRWRGAEMIIPHAMPCAKSSFKPSLTGGCPHWRLSLPDGSGLTSPIEFWASGLKVLA